jgi:hypothetical protein
VFYRLAGLVVRFLLFGLLRFHVDTRGREGLGPLTTSGGYLLVGTSYSSASGTVTGTNHGTYCDIWLVKLDAAGNIQWQKLYGGSDADYPSSFQQTADDGYIIAGYTAGSASGDIAGTGHGNYDIWVLRLDGTGTILWQKLLGGSGEEDEPSIQETLDGGFILAAGSYSSMSGDVASSSHGGADIWVVKLDGAGGIVWQRLIGGSAYDGSPIIRQTAEGGYILTGESLSSGTGNVAGANHGKVDTWVVRLDGTGAIVWQRLLGGSGNDYAESVPAAVDGGYVLLGYTDSSASGDVVGTGHGDNDLWAVKLDGTGSILWQRLLGGSGGDYRPSLGKIADGGYILLASSASSAISFS